MRNLIIFLYIIAILIAGAYIVSAGITIMNAQQQQYENILKEIHK